MEWLIAYDISNNQIRNKVSNFLLRYGYRIQYSVFYIPKATRKEIETIRNEVSRMINRRTDRVFFYPIKKIDIFKGYPLQPWDITVV